MSWKKTLASRISLVSFGVAAFVATSELRANPVCDDSFPRALMTFQCRTLSQVIGELPCGITSWSGPIGNLCAYFPNPCAFEIGHDQYEHIIDVEWRTKGGFDPGPCLALGNLDCQQAASSVMPCGGTPLPAQPCPAPNISDDCIFNCDDPLTENFPTWAPTCHAYALMPAGWRQDPWLPANAFFTLGAQFSLEWINFPTAGDGFYSAADALADGRFAADFKPMLGYVEITPLWGAKETKAVTFDRQRSEKALAGLGLCINQQGALLSSPYWQVSGMGNQGVKRFDVLTVCGSKASSGLGLYAGATHQGALLSEVLPLLESAGRHRGLGELVCLTPELAEERRQLRRASQANGEPAELQGKRE